MDMAGVSPTCIVQVHDTGIVLGIFAVVATRLVRTAGVVSVTSGT